jgi:hypothetical protein
MIPSVLRYNESKKGFIQKINTVFSIQNWKNKQKTGDRLIKTAKKNKKNVRKK